MNINVFLSCNCSALESPGEGDYSRLMSYYTIPTKTNNFVMKSIKLKFSIFLHQLKYFLLFFFNFCVICCYTINFQKKGKISSFKAKQAISENS
jgi:hypothetical protein